MTQSAVYVKTRTRRWATKTKTGCLVCRQRRIKCDESRPFCFKCQSSGRICEGYPGSYDRNNHRDKRFILPKAMPQLPKTVMDSLCDALDIMRLSPIARLGAVGKESADLLIDKQLAVSQKTRSYFHELPRVIGHEPALDTAIKSVCLLMKSTVQGVATGKQSQNLAFNQYGRALTTMQHAIWDPARAKSTLTLCAIELLCCFETFCRGIRKPSLQHLYGACQLIEFRGPAVIQSELDKALFAGKIPNFFVLGLLRGERQFLEEPQWQQAIRESVDPSGTSTYRHEVVLELYCVVVCCSGAWRACADYFASEERSLQSQAALLVKVNSIRERLLSWYAVYGNTALSFNLPDGSKKLRIEVGEENTMGNMLDAFTAYHLFLASINRSLIALGDIRGMELERQSYRDMAWMLSGIEDDLDERDISTGSLSATPNRLYNIDTTSLSGAMSSSQRQALAFVHTSPAWFEAAQNVHKIGAAVGSSSKEFEALYKTWLSISGFGALRQA
ncbi:hypothetical protein VHEMI07049 [[Torrubiella] hemipterigena]|uniref:Zn(2)-C6 fungal-type domain-containing protein n=1 Tax=[Torrubiella] hemipterigena TaxID=1531966 RepID=A0A0A1TKK4_9HYPO|nr:hypothetical protein VHEMI07049 [[Torrubiella] hemipterigena]